MAATGYTPISLYYSTTASAVPTAGNLANGELALNIADMKLYAKNSAGTVTLLASNSGATGTVSSVSGTGTVSGITLSGTVTSSGSLTLGGALDLSAYNGAGAFTTLSASGAVTLSGGTANGVTYLNGSKQLVSGSALTFDGTKYQLGVGGSTGATLASTFAIEDYSSTDQYRLTMNWAGSGKLGIGASTSSGIIFGTATGTSGAVTSQWMCLNSTGLGIGTSSPVSKLHVESASAEAFQIGYSSTKRSRLGTTSAGDLQIYAYETGVGYHNILLAVDAGTAAGNVGIGTSSPAQKLEVNTTSGSYQMRLGSGTTNTAYTYDIGRSSVDGYFRFYGNQSAAQGYIFGGANGEYARLDYSGNLVIGTTSASAKLEVKGAGATTGKTFRTTDAAGNETFALIDGGNAYLVYGGFSVGTTANAGTGGIYATGAITAYYSDERLKDVKGRIQNALAKVRRLSGVYYTNNETAKALGYTSDEMQVGVLANQMKGELPEIVKPAPFDLDEKGNSKSGKNYMTVQYERGLPLLIEAIKELADQFDDYVATH